MKKLTTLKSSPAVTSLTLTSHTVRALQDNQLTTAAGGGLTVYPCLRFVATIYECLTR